MAATMAPREITLLTNRVSRLLGDRRLSIREAARLTGVSYRALFELYHDRTARIDLVTLDRLCNYFQVSPNDIFEWAPTPPDDPDGETKAA